MHTDQHGADREEVVSTTFARRPETVAAAREWAVEVYAAFGGLLRDLCELLVSEVATNAVVHGAGDEYRVTVHPDLRIEIWDASPAKPRRRHSTETSIGGRGLEMLAAWAPGYTVCADEELGGKSVCFEPKGW
ncbi:ATP-binding protein [Actinacidiphila sp. ITFR-21]|uniref:ATP-binding protein n=1 Tax=Actinacidiphila sp. ITFR-21 TaxID=3075199 RepID=UPI00288C03FB|nr:ATP-binding protein [Streptomyces sp. ITFR-21]WNI17648.1 ATP-binding protein [Streptomyces sp. ITFR-21]WNI17788.1 ATP-binding protein [Streptomyces sp. ITFR-21]